MCFERGYTWINVKRVITLPFRYKNMNIFLYRNGSVIIGSDVSFFFFYYYFFLFIYFFFFFGIIEII